MKIFELLSGGGGDPDYEKVRKMIVKFVLDTVKTDPKTKQDFQKVLTRDIGPGSDSVQKILKVINELIDWFDEEPNTLKLSALNHARREFESPYEHACVGAFDWALTQINDKRKHDGQVHRDAINPELSKSHYVQVKAELDPDDLPTYDQAWAELVKAFPKLGLASDHAKKNK